MYKITIEAPTYDDIEQELNGRIYHIEAWWIVDHNRHEDKECHLFMLTSNAPDLPTKLHILLNSDRIYSYRVARGD